MLTVNIFSTTILFTTLNILCLLGTFSSDYVGSLRTPFMNRDSLREKCPNTELNFRQFPYSVGILENTNQK